MSAGRYGEESSGRTHDRYDGDEYAGRRAHPSGGYEATSESYRRPDESDNNTYVRAGYRQSEYGQDEDNSYSYEQRPSRRNDEDTGYRASYRPSYQPPTRTSRPYDDYSNNEYNSYRSEQENSRQEENSYGSAIRYSTQDRFGRSERTYGGDEYQPPSGFTRNPEETGYGGSTGTGYDEYSGYERERQDDRLGRSSQEGFGRSNVDYDDRAERSYDRRGDEFGGSARRANEGDGDYTSRARYGEESRACGEDGYGYGRNEGQRNYGGDDETFGAERLQINDEYEDRVRHHGHH